LECGRARPRETGARHATTAQRERAFDAAWAAALESPLGSNGLTHGTIFDIKRFAINDGPGIRTTVFFKGCPLACSWCHNPESQRPENQLACYRAKCIGCAHCVEACPEGALALGEEGVQIARDRCQRCGACARACPAEALVVIGRHVSVPDLMPELLADREFYVTSGGGITLSGGEPLLQAVFAGELAQACRAEGLDVVLDTCGHAPWEDLEAVARHCSLVLYDVKALDPGLHEAFTGVDNALILQNLRRLVDLLGADRVILRHPLIPGMNDSAEEEEALARLAAELGTAVDVLPYHRLGEGKYEALGEQAPKTTVNLDVASARAKELCEQLSSQGVACRVG